MRKLEILVALAAALSAVPLDAAAGPEGRRPASRKGPLVIGVVAPMSGPNGPFGQSVRDGVTLAIEERNARGGVRGRKLAVRIGDIPDRRDAEAVVEQVLEEHPLALVGDVRSSITLAIGPLADAHEVPLVTPAATHPAVTVQDGRVRPYVFRACFIDPVQGGAMARFAREALGLTRVGILRDSGTTYSTSIAEAFAARFERLGGTVETESYRTADEDFGPQLRALDAAGVEAVFVPGYYPDVVLMANQARALGLRQPFLGGDGWDSMALLEGAAAALEGSYFTNHAALDDPDPAAAAFRRRFAARFRRPPDILATLGYDAARMILAAADRAPALTGPALRDALERTRAFPAVTGLTTLDANHDPHKPVVVLKIADGAFRFVRRVEGPED